MLENEENKMNTENNESEVKNDSNIENTESKKTTEEMFEESDFVTPPQESEPERSASSAQETVTAETAETAKAENSSSAAQETGATESTSDSHIKGTEGASQYRYSYIQNHKKQDQVNGDQHNDHQETSKQKRKHKRSMNLYAKVICCAILFGAISGGMVLGSFMIGKNAVKTTASSTTLETNAAKLSTSSGSKNGSSSSSGDTYTVAQIAEQCKSSVVAITNQSVQEVQTMFGTMQQQSTGSGSGVIIGKNDTELLIATNNHVVSGAESLTVCFNDDKDAVFDAKIKGTDADNDLAVIAIKLSDISEDVLNSISVATLGDSTQMEVGDQVVAIGNALGFGQSVTSGVISALDREVTIDDTTATLMQTDAAINPGNSGGALFNMKGEVIGINSAKYASDQVEGMGFAIPMAKAQGIIENLMNQETRDKLTSDYGFLNITGQDVSSDVAEMYGIPEGVYVSGTTDGGAAANAGIQKGDIITKLGNTTITSISQLKEELQYYKAGETVEITLQRNTDNKGYQEQTVKVTLDNASEQSNTTSQSDSSQSQSGTQTVPGYGSDGSSNGNSSIEDFFNSMR
ncbi:S1C family serine protease [Eubacterium ramulus]|uniref:S1C family serine protease n=1 Tax=Eubacterium ramulus TaxID=39490 RepID=UPI0022E31DF7|nr:trypsin-like peptidase domain-containing protein [Eubacterium ramulus]